MRGSPSRLGSLALLGWLLAGCGPAPPSIEPQGVPPLFALPGAFVEAAPRETVVVYETDLGTDVMARIEEGARLQLIERSEHGRFKIQFYDAIEGSAFGWADIGSVAHPLVRPPAQPLRCPLQPAVGMMSGLWEPERLSCFGDSQLTFPAVLLARGEVLRQYDGDPEWLAEVNGITARDGPGDGQLMAGLHLPPEISLPAQDQWVRIVGRFDDPRSSTCNRRSLVEGLADLGPGNAALWCRQQFVVHVLSATGPPSLPTQPPDVEGP